jgi:hypothetical protein
MPKSLPLKYSSSTLDVMHVWSSSSSILLSSFCTGMQSCFLQLCLFWSTSQILILNFLSFFFFFLHKELNFGCLNLLQGAPGPWCELLHKTILGICWSLINTRIKFLPSPGFLAWSWAAVVNQNHKIITSSAICSEKRRLNSAQNQCKDTNHSLWFLSHKVLQVEISGKKNLATTGLNPFKAKKEWIARFYIKLSYVAKNIKGFLYIFKKTFVWSQIFLAKIIIWKCLEPKCVVFQLGLLLLWCLNPWMKPHFMSS